jgi:hypothetical protein
MTSRIATAALALILGAAPLIASADVYINIGSPGFRLSSIQTIGCTSAPGGNAKCNDTATGTGGSVTFEASDLNGNCSGANPNKWPCYTNTWCFIKMGRHQSGAFGQNTHYDVLQLSTQVGGPSSTPGAISVGPQYKVTRRPCSYAWNNDNTITVYANKL